jgi:hypothetical protein
MFIVSFRTACLSVLSLHVVFCALFFSNDPTKNQMLLGPANEEALAHHQTSSNPLRKETAKRSHANHCRVGRSTILLKPQINVWWKLWG